MEAATPAPTRTPQPTNTPLISSPQPVDDYQLTTIDLTPTPFKLGFKLTDFHDRFVNKTKGFALCGEITTNGESGMYWRFGLSPDGNSEFAFGDVGFRSVNQTSEEGYSIWLDICYEDSSESFKHWVASIRSPEDLYSTNQYDAFKEITCCFIKTLDPRTSDEEAYQVLFDAIQKGAEENYQYHALSDNFSLGEGTGFPRAGDFEFTFAFGGNWLELDARRYQQGKTVLETLDIAQYEKQNIQSAASDSEISVPISENFTTEMLHSSASPTLGETNALNSAQSYLSYIPFSHDGLIDQLEYEGFTIAEATYAAENCGANWNEQALKSAYNYLSFMAFSYTEMIDQLVYDKYTQEQATYAAENCGANWYEQAIKSAANYLSFSSFSRDALIEQLE